MTKFKTTSRLVLILIFSTFVSLFFQNCGKFKAIDNSLSALSTSSLAISKTLEVENTDDSENTEPSEDNQDPNVEYNGIMLRFEKPKYVEFGRVDLPRPQPMDVGQTNSLFDANAAAALADAQQQFQDRAFGHRHYFYPHARHKFLYVLDFKTGQVFKRMDFIKKHFLEMHNPHIQTTNEQSLTPEESFMQSGNIRFNTQAPTLEIKPLYTLDAAAKKKLLRIFTDAFVARFIDIQDPLVEMMCTQNVRPPYAILQTSIAFYRLGAQTNGCNRIDLYHLKSKKPAGLEEFLMELTKTITTGTPQVPPPSAVIPPPLRDDFVNVLSDGFGAQ